MSEIDQYPHNCIGIVNCPASYPIVFANDTHRTIPIYRLEAPAEEWQAKVGDVLLGGGSGESAVLRLSMPETIYFFTQADWDAFEQSTEIVQAYWTATEAYVFGEGYHKVGWRPSLEIEWWLAAHITAFLLGVYPASYQRFRGEEPLPQSGAICRVPTEEERRVW